jgi:hypothetical protein
MRIGEFLVQKGVLSTENAEKILAYGVQRGLRFGDAGLELGLLTRDAMIQAFGPNFRIDFFHLDPRYFPASTRGWFPVDAILRWGALPLGLKREGGLWQRRHRLNVGLLDPSRRDCWAGIEEAARAHLGEQGRIGLRAYLVLPDEFCAILRAVYAIGDKPLGEFPSADLDPTLALYLGRA